MSKEESQVEAVELEGESIKKAGIGKRDRVVDDEVEEARGDKTEEEVETKGTTG